MHRYNIVGPDDKLLAVIDAIELELYSPSAIQIHGVVVWFPVNRIRIELTN